MQPSRDIRRLIDIMAALRDPAHGCPWDVEQTFASIAPFTIEEAYEVADAIERGGTEDLREELGDLLLQVVFHARMAEEAGLFDFGGVVDAITPSSSAVILMSSATPRPSVLATSRRYGGASRPMRSGQSSHRARSADNLKRTGRARWTEFRWRCRRCLAR